MASRLKGLDQITAWVGALGAAALIAAGVWYGSKYFAEQREFGERNEIDAVLSEIDQPDKTTHETPSDSDSTPGNDHAGEHNRKKAAAPLEKYGYAGNLAPWYWSNLNDKWHQCGLKTNQSPIDLSGAQLDERLKTLKFFYLHGATNISFENQTVRGLIERGSYIEWDGERFDLNSVYFRTPSEHRVNSLPFEMEVQLEHESVDGRTIMVSILLTTGKSNDLIESIAKSIPKLPGDTVDVERLNWSDLLPHKRTYWTYIGSSTIPPCSPGVRWIVFTQETSASKTSIDQFVLKQKSNARPVFSLGKRSLTRSNR